jgi:uncharacterized protein (DUF1330 family)
MSMPYYFYSNIRITDPQEYQKYLDKVDAVCSKFNGKYLTVGNSPALLEGKWTKPPGIIGMYLHDQLIKREPSSSKKI